MEKESILKSFIPQLQEFVSSETVFGKSLEIDGLTIIPVHSVKVGFGFGDGDKEKKNNLSGGGGGILLTPIAFLIIKDDNVTLHSLSAGTVENVLEKVPDFLEKTYSFLEKIIKKIKQK